MSITAVKAVLKHSHSNGTDLTVLLAIAVCGTEPIKGKPRMPLNAWPSIKKLAADVNRDHSTVKRSINRLENARELIVYERPGMSNMFEITVVPGWVWHPEYSPRIPFPDYPGGGGVPATPKPIAGGGIPATPQACPNPCEGVAPAPSGGGMIVEGGVAKSAKRGGSDATRTIEQPDIKQQQPSKDDAVVDFQELVELLTTVGIEPRKAEELAARFPDRIRQQVKWLPFRNPKDPAGMLISAIEEGWAEPANYKTDCDEADKADRRKNAAIQAAREQYKKQFEPHYFEWLANTQADKLRSEYPEQFAGFEAHREVERDRYVSNFTDEKRSKFRDRFDEPHNVGKALLDLFADVLPDFWTWDAEHNPQRFQDRA